MLNKKFISLLVFMLVFSLFTGCSGASSKESQGVPDSVIRNTDEYQKFADNFESVNFDILHDMDTETHIDSVIVTLGGKTRYANTSCRIYYHFQYHKSDDLWTMIDSSTPTYSTTLNSEAFISDSPWKGKHNNTDSIGAFNNEYTYEIYIDDITEDSISLRYYFLYSNDRYDDIVQDTTVELPLNYNKSNYYVDIDLSHLYTTFESDLKLYLTKNGLWSLELNN